MLQAEKMVTPCCVVAKYLVKLSSVIPWKAGHILIEMVEKKGQNVGVGCFLLLVAKSYKRQVNSAGS